MLPQMSRPLRILAFVAFGLALLALFTFHMPASPGSLLPGGSEISSLSSSKLRSQLLAVEEQARDGQDGRFDLALVINLAHRPDRRSHMSKLSGALDLPFTFVDAISTKHSVVPWILERLLEDQTAAKDLAGGLEMLVTETKWGRTHDRTWREQALEVLQDESLYFTLTNADNLTGEKLVYPPAYRKTSSIDAPGPTACWLSHLKAMKTAIDSGAQNVLILEDDVDAEFNLVDKWKEMRRGLDKRGNGWDMVYLGFIWGDEKVFKPTFHPGLRQTNGPSGLHAYALSHRGLRRLFHLLTTDPTIFRRPIDHDVPLSVIQRPRLARERGEVVPWEFEAYTTVPPLIIPGGDLAGLGTDIGGIGGTLWGGLLADSTMKRIAEAEGHPYASMSDEDVLQMLAVKNM